jgi:starch synthase
VRRSGKYHEGPTPALNLINWGGRIRTSEWRYQKPLPYHLATPHYRKIKAAIIAHQLNILQGRDKRIRHFNRRRVLQLPPKSPNCYIENMRIVHIASEFAPIAKAGGLGEVLLGLPKELDRAGHKVDVIIPKYDFINPANLPHLKIQLADFKCLEYSNTMWTAAPENFHLHLLEARHPAGYFHRGKIYGCEDDIARFLYFSRAALEYLLIKNESIDVLHLHDWHVAFCAPLVKDLFKGLCKTVVLSLHNVEYQGKCATYDLDAIGINGSNYLTKEKLQDNDPKYPNTINLLKGGIVYADAIIPVSSSYAKEILTPAFGFGLDTTLRKNEKKITGIVNGIDTQIWNPAKDPYLKTSYEIASSTKGKEANRKNFPLDHTKSPWVGAVTRLVPQKGPELLEEALKQTLSLGGCFLLLGSSPMEKIQNHFNKLKEKYKNNNRVLLHFDYDESLAHLIYAALDFLLVPSHFEPCGLTQLIAMRYGTVPIVRKTGGLQDTVFDCEDGQIPYARRNGFVFKEPTKASLNQTLQRAFNLFHKESATFNTLVKRGMESDFSWKKPAQEYLKIYTAYLSLASK